MGFMNLKMMLGGNVFGYFTNYIETKKILDCASRLNITAIDTADVYSDGLSEKMIGKIIHEQRSKWFVATKIGLKSNQSPNGLGNPKNIIQKVEQSLKRLKTDYIDLYQLHNFDPTTPLEETIMIFEKLIKKGIIRLAGISNFSLEQLKGINSKVLTLHQMCLNICNYYVNNEIMHCCKKKNLKIIAYSSLNRGLLNFKYLNKNIPKNSRAFISSNIRKDLTKEFLQKLKKTSDLCLLHNISILELALNWLKRFEVVEYLIIGIRNIKQLKESLNC